MNLLESWVRTPLAEALGWTLVHSVWEGLTIAAALVAALAIIPSPRSRYRAACVALCAMLCSFIATLIYMMPAVTEGARAVHPPVFPTWRVVADFGASGLSGAGMAALIPWLAPLWLAGVGLFGAYHVAGWASVSRLRRRGVCCAPEPWQTELTRRATAMRLSRSVRLLESCLADTPMVLGHFSPVILMPVGLLAGLPPAQVVAILLHELAHIRRSDYLVNAWQRVAEGLLFYHPAVWWIARVIREEREHCCDDIVVAASGDARQYAAALAALEQNRWSGRQPAMAATGGNLVKRIHRLLYPKRPHSAWTSFSIALLVVAGAAVSFGAWQPTPAMQSPTMATVTTDTWAKWLNEDVVYLIQDDERAAFVKLTSDAERQHFADQFWLRRDPTPGTPENEFKKEHYRRIAYANGHYLTASGRAGWQNDRGHMYILYGPPDEIDAHPNGYQESLPYEEWKYRQIDGMGKDLYFVFVDRAKTGDYRIAPRKSTDH
jgi:GWxTD domain-containing protein